MFKGVIEMLKVVCPKCKKEIETSVKRGCFLKCDCGAVFMIGDYCLKELKK